MGCQHTRVNRGFAYFEEDRTRVTVTELCLDCLETRPLTFHMTKMGEWMTIEKFKEEHNLTVQADNLYIEYQGVKGAQDE